MKTLIKLIVFLFYLFILGCNTKIVLVGNVKNMPGDRVYMIQKRTNDVPRRIIDSATILNNSFTFLLKVKRNYIPKLVCLEAEDSSCHGCSRPIYIYDDKHTLDSLHWTRNYFYYESGITKITGDYKSNYLHLQSGKENESYFALENSELWEFENNDSLQRIEKINRIQELIIANPYSPVLFYKTDNSKVNFTVPEMQKLIFGFSNRILKTHNGKEFIQYYKEKSKQDAHPIYKNFQLKDSSNQLKYVLNNQSKITLVSVWASWCIPCLEEIPTLTRLYNKYKDRGLEIISISCDKEESDWTNELENLKLPWKQFIIPKDENSKWTKHFDSYTIPTTIILSKDFQRIEQFHGYDKNYEHKIDSVINKNLN